MKKKAIIIGAGPAGLTAAYELLKRTDIVPIILEKSGEIGGISKTVNYKGNRIDIGGHRFFSKSDRVMSWWLNIMPIQPMEEKLFTITYQKNSRTIRTEEPLPKLSATEQSDNVMLVRKRLSRIYFLRQFFTYPIQLSLDTLRKLGLSRTVGILFSYLKSRLFPRKPEKSLEDFLINRFGDKLYRLFFKDYTEKVWGVSCEKISAEWGAQRIKGISIGKAILHAARALKPSKKREGNDISQKGVETSLIERFLYPKFGPGQMWEETARQVKEMGAEIQMNCEVKEIHADGNQVVAIEILNKESGETELVNGDYFFSTMPVQELIAGMNRVVPDNVKEVASGLQYRDFITVGVLLKKQVAAEKKEDRNNAQSLPDTWIYIQEKDVKVGRLQIFNNWSPYMVKDPETVWIGMEFFCNKGDEFWSKTDAEIQNAGILELQKMGLANIADVLDSTVLRMEKTYPAYFGTYERFEEVKAFTDSFENLFLVGRNGMHKYNNSDHSMLTAMVSVDNIIAGETSKANIWAINTEQEYHEEKATLEKTQEESGQEHIAKRPTQSPQHELLPSFIDYVWRNKGNRAYLLFALAAFLIQFILFKIKYPFANYMPDSYSYLEAAYTNADVNTWPVAYSKFLRQISVFTHSDKVVVAIQYLFLQFSSLIFLFTLLYFLKPGRAVKNILYAFFLFNPVTLYMSNYISADALFIGFSLLWFNSLLWIIFRPQSWQIWVQAFLLLICFTIRYNAIYYPLITIMAFILSRQSWIRKLAGASLGFLLLFGSVAYTSHKMLEVSGKNQFSAFGGWQIANNALYMYENIPASRREPVPVQFSKLETMVRKHMDTLSRVKLTLDDTVSAHFYLWSEKGPLVQYMVKEWRKDSAASQFRRWASEGPLYGAYGLYLIRKYPIDFARTFILPNVIRYAVPPPEFLSIYNMGGDSVGKLAKEWFNYKTQKVRDHNNKAVNIGVTRYYPYFSTLINVFLVICSIGLAIFTGFKRDEKGLPRILLMVLFFWVVNMGFSVFASPIAMRYQIFPVLVSFCLAVLAAESIYKWGIQHDVNLKKKML